MSSMCVTSVSGARRTTRSLRGREKPRRSSCPTTWISRTRCGSRRVRIRASSWRVCRTQSLRPIWPFGSLRQSPPWAPTSEARSRSSKRRACASSVVVTPMGLEPVRARVSQLSQADSPAGSALDPSAPPAARYNSLVKARASIALVISLLLGAAGSLLGSAAAVAAPPPVPATRPAPAPVPPRPAVKPAAPRLVTSVEGISEYALGNGMRVLLFPDPSKDTFTVNVTYLVGSRMEGYGETGMAHLLEHMMFKGSPRHPKIWEELEQRG